MTSKFFSIVFASILAIPHIAQASPFNIVPKAGTTLPTQLTTGQTTSALYTITNNTGSVRSGNYIKYLPANVTQVTSNNSISDLCPTTFMLQPNHAAGDSCTLQLLISDAVNSSAADSHQQLFACFPGGITCAGTTVPLNVAAVAAPSEFVAVGDYFVTKTSTNYMGIANSTQAGTSWSQQVLKLPSNYTRAFLIGASCSENNCVGVGAYFDSNDTAFPAITLSNDKGASWSQQSLTLPSGFNNGLLDGVSCIKNTCVAVGVYSNTLTELDQPGIATTTNAGSTWSQQALPLPSGKVVGQILGVNCTGNTCIGVGVYEDSDFNMRPGIFVSTDHGISWSQQMLTLPNTFVDGFLNGVACIGNACIAVGDYFDESDDEHLAVAISTNSGNSWSQKTLTPPGSFTQGSFNGISCTGKYCVAVGNYALDVDYTIYPGIAVTRDNGASWAQQTLPIPSGYTYAYLNGVNCVDKTCVAAGYYQGTSLATPFVAFSSDSGNTWSQQVISLPTGIDVGLFGGVG